MAFGFFVWHHLLSQEPSLRTRISPEHERALSAHSHVHTHTQQPAGERKARVGGSTAFRRKNRFWVNNLGGERALGAIQNNNTVCVCERKKKEKLARSSK
jgi:hypothetical protein